MQWEFNTSTVTITQENQKDFFYLAGRFFLWGISVFIFLILAAFFGLSLYFPEKVQLNLFWFAILLFDLMLFFTAYNQKNLVQESKVRIDLFSETLKIKKQRKGIEATISIHTFQKVRIFKDIRQLHGINSERPQEIKYEIFLVQKNGSYFWLDTVFTEKRALELASKLSSFLNIELDSSLRGFSESSGLEESIPEKGHLLEEFEPANRGLVRLSMDRDSFHTLTIPKIEPLSEKLVTLLLFLFLACIPFLMTDNSAGLIANLVSFSISIFVYLIFALAYFSSRKNYILAARDRILRIQVQFPGFMKSMNTEIDLPADHIVNIQIHRLDGGHYWLALQLKDGCEINMGDRIKANIGVFRKGALRQKYFHKQILGLWEVPFSKPDNKELSFQDLQFIRSWLIQNLDVL